MASPSPDNIAYQRSHSHENRSKELIAACVVCLTAAYLAVPLRFLSRRLGKTALKADDYTIVIALVRNQTALVPCGESLTLCHFQALHDWVCDHCFDQ